MIRVMIVEDEPPIMRMLQQFIEDYNECFQVVETAINGKKAMEILACQPIDLVFTDICMPVMDGLALTEKIREEWPEMRIVIVSGYQEFDYVRTALRYRVSDYLLKPILQEDVAKLLKTMKEELQEVKGYNKSEQNNDIGIEIPNIVVEVQNYIQNNYQACINTNSLAKEFGFVPSYISKIFKNHKGVSPSEYLLHYRIEKAKELMRKNPKILIKEVALHTGFSDQHHFSKCFKKHMQIWPTEYIEKIKRV